MTSNILLDVLSSGTWGTVGPRMFEAGNLLAGYLNMKYALITHSRTSALEVLLRAMEITYGDKVITASYSDPMDSLTAAAVGAEPVFADIDYNTGTISPDSVEARIKSEVNVKAVIADIIGGNPCDAAELARICKENDILFILNAGDGVGTMLNGIEICSYADAVVYDLSVGGLLDIGKGGAVVTNGQNCYYSSYSYHTCGRSIGGDTTALEFDKIIGGDFRVTEWHACLLREALEKAGETLRVRAEKVKETDRQNQIDIIDGGISSRSYVILKDRAGDCGTQDCAVYKVMHRQPFFESGYFRKLTGRTYGYDDKGLENSIKAGNNYRWRKV